MIIYWSLGGRGVSCQEQEHTIPPTLQYGLIAEEVAEFYPELVQYDPKSGEPQTVYYHFVNAMLLNEVQKQQRQIIAQNKEISDLNKRLARLEALLNK